MAQYRRLQALESQLLGRDDCSAARKQISFEDFKGLVGKEVGVSAWHAINQDRVNAFAECTEDRQWIHIDVERAKAESPFGGPIAHGFLTLSLLSAFNAEAMPSIDGIKMGVNYGLNKVRFISPVPVGSRVRGSVKLLELAAMSGGYQATLQIIAMLTYL